MRWAVSMAMGDFCKRARSTSLRRAWAKRGTRPRAPHDQRTKWAYIFGAILPLPSRPPELNPVENIWQFMRDNWLSNRVFDSHDDIVEHCCDVWNKLIDQPWKIMSIGLRDWAHA